MKVGLSFYEAQNQRRVQRAGRQGAPPAGRADDAAKLRSNRIASAESEPTAPDRSIELHRAQTAAAAAQSEKASSVVKAAKADRASSAAQTAKADRASSAAQAAKAERASSATKSGQCAKYRCKAAGRGLNAAQSEARSADDLPRQSQSEVCPARVPHGPMGRIARALSVAVGFSGMSLRNFSARRSYERMKLSLCAGWYTPGERSSQDRARLLCSTIPPT